MPRAKPRTLLQRLPGRRVCSVLATRVAMVAFVFLSSGCATNVAHRHPPQSVLLPCDQEACLRVVSWNVHGLPFYSKTSDRMRRIAAKIAEQQPDLVLLQEVWFGRFRSLLARTLEADYQIAYDPRWVTGWPRGGLVMFVRHGSGWRVSTSTFRRYDASAPWYRLTEFDGVSGKGILAATVSSGSSSLAVIDTHLQSQYKGRPYLHVRSEQIMELLQLLERKYPSTPILIGGDFNTGAKEELYASELSNLGDDLTVEERKDCQCGTNFGDDGTWPEWIDYVLVKNWKVRATVQRIENDFSDNPYSDHDGLLVRLLYERTSLRVEDVPK